MKNIIFKQIINNTFYYHYKTQIETIDLEVCRKNWQNHVNESSEFSKTDYSSKNCIGFIDSSTSPMRIRIYGNEILEISISTSFEKIQNILFKYRKYSYKKLSNIKNSFIKAGWTLYDYS